MGVKKGDSELGLYIFWISIWVMNIFRTWILMEFGGSFIDVFGVLGFITFLLSTYSKQRYCKSTKFHFNTCKYNWDLEHIIWSTFDMIRFTRSGSLYISLFLFQRWHCCYQDLWVWAAESTTLQISDVIWECVTLKITQNTIETESKYNSIFLTHYHRLLIQG